MYTNQFESISQQNDIYKVLNFKQNPETVEQEEILEILNQRAEKIEKQILKGELTIFDPRKIKDQIQQLQKERVKKEKELQTPQVQKNQLLVRQLKREIIKLRQEQTSLAKEESKLKKKQIMEQIKKWQQIQAQIKAKKEEMDLQQEKKQNQQKMKLQKEQEEIERKKRIEKKKQIQNNIKDIQKNREKRLEILKFAELEYQKLNPKYLEIQKKYQQIENQMKFEEDILKKNHSLSTKFDYGALKKHEKDYMNKVEERNKKRQSLRAFSVEEKKTDFTPFLERDQTRIQEQKLKLKRRQDFLERLKEIPIPTDANITLQIQIKKDKDQHPLKYNFLGQKHLTNQQIFEQFPNFEINIHPKEVGSEYLRELPTINQRSRVTRSQSQSALLSNFSERVKYKDYLNDLKVSRPIQMDIDQEELLKSNQSVENKKKILQLLAQREKKYSLELKKRQQQLYKSNTVRTSMRKTKEIDEIYSKSIKAKLARLQINQ